MAGFPTADTFDSLIDEVITSLVGYTYLQDDVATLTADVTDTSLSIPVDDATLSKGIIEIDQELIRVSAASNGLLTIPPWGRGYKGTARAAHASGSAVYVSPAYPRSIVAREVQNTIRAVFPDLFAVKTADLTASAFKWQYELPADVERVLSVETRWDLIAGWLPARSWEVTGHGSSTDFPTSQKFLSVIDAIPVTTRIHVTYAAQPALLVNPSDPFTTTGLLSTSRDVIVLGAASRLLPWIDAGRTPAETVGADVADAQRPIGAAVQLAQQMRQRYMERLAKERTILEQLHPMRAHKVRG